MTGAPYVFLIPLLAASEEGLIQVIGDKVLEKEIRFSVSMNTWGRYPSLMWNVDGKSIRWIDLLV